MDKLIARVVEVHRNNRESCSSGYIRTAHLIHHWLTEAGLEDVQIIHFPADGKTLLGDWILPKAWDGWHSSLVPLVDGKELSKPMAVHDEEPCALALYSAPSPPEGKLFSLVNEEELSTMRGEASHSMLLCRSGNVHQWARIGHLLKKKRPGGMALWDPSPSLPDRERRWLNDFFLPGNKAGQIGLSLSASEGRFLENLKLKHGKKLRVRVKVQSRLYTGTIPLVTGVIAGQENGKEFWVTSQMCEQGAWDNHAGAVAAIESFIRLNEAIERGRLERPRHGLRLVLSMELYGFMAYAFLRRKDTGRTVIGGFCMEGLGHAIDHPETHFMLFNTYEQSPSFGDALLPHVFHLAAKQLLPRTEPQWSLGPAWLSDNCISDPQIGVSTPSVYQVVNSKGVWHTSMDTPDRIKGDSLRFHAALCAAYLSVAASGNKKVLEQLLRLTFKHALDTLKNGFPVRGEPSRPIDREERAAYWLEKSKKILRSVLDLEFAQPDRQARLYDRRFLAGIRSRFGCRPGFKRPETDLEKALAALVPRRLVFGNLTFRKLQGKARAEAEKYETAYSMAYNVPVFWMDGERTCYEIHRRLVQERDPMPLAKFWEFCRFLRDHQYIELRAVGVGPPFAI